MTTYPLLVRDGLMARVRALPFFTGHDFHFTTNKSLQIQPQSIPFCGVYLIEEVGLPDGDPNDAEPRFHTTARYGFSVIIQNNDADAAERKLDDAMQAISSLFTDPTLYNNNQFKIQAYLRGSRTHQFGSIGLDNEIPIAELRYDLTCDLGVITYPPYVPDAFKTLHLDTRYPSGEDAGVQQIGAVWDILQSETASSRFKIRSSLRVDVTVI